MILQVKLLFDIAASNPGLTTMCEVGFNAGHSALAFLVADPAFRVVSFDLGAHQYVVAAHEVR